MASYQVVDDHIDWTLTVDKISQETATRFGFLLTIDTAVISIEDIHATTKDGLDISDNFVSNEEVLLQEQGRPIERLLEKEASNEAYEGTIITFTTAYHPKLSIQSSIFVLQENAEVVDLLANQAANLLLISKPDIQEPLEDTPSSSQETRNTQASEELTQENAETKAANTVQETSNSSTVAAETSTSESESAVEKNASTSSDSQLAEKTVQNIQSRATTLNASGNLSVTKENFMDYFVLNGSATYDKKSGIVTLTPNKNNQVGNFTLKTKIDMSQSFTLRGGINLGSNIFGADGVSFGFHEGNTSDIGIFGGNLGIAGLQNATAFKLDTYHNTYKAPSGSGDTTNQYGWAEDPRPNGFNKYGGFVNTTYKKVNGYDRWWAEPDTMSAKALSSRYINGRFYDFTVNYDGSTHKLTITFDKLSWSKTANTSQAALAMFVAASTGGAKNLQQFRIDSFDYHPYGVINTVYLDKTTNQPIISGQQFSGLIGNSQNNLCTAKEQISQLGYTYDSVTSSDSTRYDSENDTGIYGVEPLLVTYYYCPPVDVELTKIDEQTNQPLADVTFDLQDSHGNIIKSGLVTDHSGKLTVAKLPLGDYQFVETKAATGYQIATTPMVFSIDTTSGTKVEVTAKNTLKEFSPIVMKYDADTNEVVAGATFVFATNQENGVLLDTIGSGTSDSHGYLQFKETLSLSAGQTYYLKETTAPAGYSGLTGYFKLTIAANGQSSTLIYYGKEEVPAIQATINLQSEANKNTVSFSIPNHQKVTLPATGGSTKTIFLLAGLTGLVVSLTYFWWCKLQEVV